MGYNRLNAVHYATVVAVREISSIEELIAVVIVDGVVPSEENFREMVSLRNDSKHVDLMPNLVDVLSEVAIDYTYRIVGIIAKLFLGSFGLSSVHG